MYQHSDRTRGFTLIELLVVVAIIGILSSVVLASLNSARQKGRDTRRISDIKQLQLALELYYDANSSYPTTTLATLAPTYISVIPTDPNPSTPYVYAPLTSAGAACSASTCASYVLRAILEDKNHSALAGDWDTDMPGVTCTDAASSGQYCVRP